MTIINELGIIIENNRPVVSSRKVAEVFEKEHKHVMESIRELDCGAEFNGSNFRLTSYKDSMNRDKPEYLMTRLGFSVLTMTNELGIVIENNRPVVSSRKVAEVFEKEHKNVIQSITMLECDEEFSRLNFQPSTYISDRGYNLAVKQVRGLHVAVNGLYGEMVNNR